MGNILHLEIEKLEREISACGTRIETLKVHIQNQEKEIALVKNLTKQLEQNLSMLKDGSIIASASEYKKVKADLIAMSRKVEMISIDLKNSHVYLDRAKKLYIDLKDKYAIISVNQIGKVLTGHFRKQE